MFYITTKVSEILAINKKSKYSKGTRIIIKEDDFYIGTVTSIRLNKIYVLFDDGDKVSYSLKSKKLIGVGIKRKHKSAIPKSKLDQFLVKDKNSVSSLKTSLIKFNLVKLKKDPINYVKNLTIKQIITILDKADNAYYNTNKSLFSDNVYDSILDELRLRNPRHKRLKKVGSPIAIKTKGKVKLSHYLGSLDKLKPETVDKWLNKYTSNYVSISDKMDGVSLLLEGTKTGWNLFTRGDGTYGQDISHLSQYLKLPKPRQNKVIRTELIMKPALFKKFGIGANPRNMIAGLTTKKNLDSKTITALKKVNIVAYELIEPKGKKPSNQFKLMKSMGFITAPNSKLKNLNSDKLSKLLKIRKSKSKFEIDGLVLTVDEKYTRAKGKNPSYSKAFKDNSLGTLAQAYVKGIEWNLSRHNFWKPVVIIQESKTSKKGISLGGVTIRRVTGINAKFIVENSIGKGSLIKISRSGDVIPKIESIIKATKPDLPKEEFEWNDTGVDIYTPNPEDFSIITIKKITTFFRTIGVENFSKGLIERFYNDGLNTILKIIKASKDRLLKIEGIQEKLAIKITEGINSSLTDVDLHILMFASGSFTREIGSRRIETILKAIPNTLTMKEDLLFSKIIKLQGFQKKTANSFILGLPKFKKFQKSLPKKVTISKPKLKKVNSGKLTGINIVFTGFRDKDLKNLIENNGGEIKSGISKKVNILLVKDISSTTTKMQKALNLGIKVMPKDLFIKNYNL